MRKFFQCVCFLIYSISTFAQVPNSAPLFQNPTTSSLGMYGKFDISQFTGLADIGIDVFDLKEGDINVKAFLNYNSGGIKPSNHPGWVGQNWSLNVGGVVTRKVNGGVDEVYYMPTDGNYATINGVTDNKDTYSYFYNPSILAPTNSSFNPPVVWDDPSWVKQYFPNDATNPPHSVVAAPDEFMFTLPNGVSGSFYENYDKSWMIKTKDAVDLHITVLTNLDITTNPNINPFNLPMVEVLGQNAGGSGLDIKRIIYSIVISDNDGFAYTFGNNDNAIEFNRGPRPQTLSDQINASVVANSWYLTSIKSPKGNLVTFNYQRGPAQYVQSTIYPGSFSTNFAGIENVDGEAVYSSGDTGVGYDYQVISPVYLQSITCSSFQVNFTQVESNELLYAYNNSFRTSDFWYADLPYSDQTTPDMKTVVQWYKLTGITIVDPSPITNPTNVASEEYAFVYNTDSDPAPGHLHRLFLTQFKQLNHGATNQDKTYSFSYNGLNTFALLPYNAMTNDLWGYYNGKPFPASFYQMSSSDIYTATYNALAPDSTYSIMGSLYSITYPTAGTTTFSYGQNDYSNVVQNIVSAAAPAQLNGAPMRNNAQTISNTISLTAPTATQNYVSGSLGQGGGLRIREITNTDGSGNSYNTTYTYKSLATGQSSGILAGNKQFYHKTNIALQAQKEVYIVNDFDPLDYTQGREVVYSEVRKKNPDGSYSVSKYSNFDNPQYADDSPVFIYTDAYSYVQDSYHPTNTETSSATNPYPSFCSRELERGQLLSVDDYIAKGTHPIHSIINTYNSDPARFNQYVPAYNTYSLTAESGGGTYSVDERYFQAIKIYTYFPYLNSTTEIFYDQVTNNPIQTVSTFNYASGNAHRQLESTTKTDSKNYTSIDKTYYNIDYINGSFTETGFNSQAIANFTAMYASPNYIIAPIEKTRTVNGVLTDKQRFNYNTSNWLDNIQSAVGNNALETRVLNTAYDNKGHVIEEMKSNDIKYSYLYDDNYPVAEIINSANGDVAYTSFESSFYGGWMLTGARTTVPDPTCPTGQLSFGYVSSTTVATRAINVANVYIVSFWNKTGTISVSAPGGTVTSLNTLNGLNGWIYYQYQISNASSVALNTSGVGNIDELRLYPQNAQMTTYTYTPLVGITSKTAANDVSDYYSYDRLNRLLIVRDRQQKILKTYQYNYAKP